jgi:hypothetical protein
MSQRRFLLPLLLAAASACGGGDLVLPGGAPAQVVMIHGDQQEAVAGAPLGDSLVVRVVDTAGVGVPNQEVSWGVALGGGRVDPPSTTTDANGIAWTRWTLGPDAGPNAVRASAGGAGFVTFAATATEAPSHAAARIESVEGEDQSATVGSLVPVRPAVKVTDAGGEPVANVEVTFVVTGGGGTVEGGSVRTDADGLARPDSWRLGSTPGTNTLEARAGSLDGSPVVFRAEGTAGAGVDHFVFRLQPHDLDVGDQFRVEVAMVDAVGNVVDLSGILIYIGLFEEGSETPDNTRLSGNRFRDTEHGVAVFDGLSINREGRYRIRALSDQLPELGPHGPEPFLFSLVFEVE